MIILTIVSRNIGSQGVGIQIFFTTTVKVRSSARFLREVPLMPMKIKHRISSMSTMRFRRPAVLYSLYFWFCLSNKVLSFRTMLQMQMQVQRKLQEQIEVRILCHSNKHSRRSINISDLKNGFVV